MSKRALGFMNKALPITYNTYIGGVSATISTDALLATKLGISVGRISNFTIVGSDIKCKITGSYEIPAGAFGRVNAGFNFPNVVTYYYDDDNLVTTLNPYSFCYQTNFNDFRLDGVTSCFSYCLSQTPVININLPNLTSCSNYAFLDAFKAKRYYIPRITSLGTTLGNNFVWQDSNYTGTVIYINPIMQTNNAGAPDGDLVATTNANIRYVTNFTAPNPITTLAGGTVYNTAIQLNFTAPSSTNAIEFYECYANGEYKNTITASGQYITGLTPNTFYNITLKAVDIFYNKSIVSNSLSVSTTNRIAVDTDAIAYITASSNTVYQDIIDDLFVSFKSNYLYAKLQPFYPFLGTTAAQHKWNAKNPLDTNAAFRLTFSGAATFSNNGYQLNGSSYANTYFAPSANQNVNSNGLTIVCGTNNASFGTDNYEIGSFNSGSQNAFFGVKINNSTYTKTLGLNGTYVTYTNINESRGIFTGTKQSATVTNLFRNSIQLATGNSGGTLPNVNTWIGCVNTNGTPYGYSNQRIQFVAIHEGLSDAEVATLHTIIDTFETAIGRKTW